MIYNNHIINLPNFVHDGIKVHEPYTKVMAMIEQAFPGRTIIDSSMLMLFQNYYPKAKHFKLFSPPESRKKQMLLVQLIDPYEYLTNDNPHIKEFGWEGIQTISDNNCHFRIWGEAFRGMCSTHGMDKRTNYDINWGDDFRTFLMYNRKPHEHRVQAVKYFKDNNLLDEGYVSLASDLVINAGHNDNADLMNNDPDLPVSDGSLGDDNVWASHFVNVISECTISPCTSISEKAYKPIVGLRPFINLSNERNEYLRIAGFKTFNSFWDEGLEWKEQLEYICSQSKSKLREWYESDEMQDILLHNREHYFNAYSDINYAFLDDYLKKMSN